MKIFTNIWLLLLSGWVYGQCSQGINAVFDNYTQQLEAFNYGKDVFHLVMTQTTYFEVDGQKQSQRLTTELISDGYLKHLQVGNTSVHTNKEVQILIDRDKQNIVISSIVSPEPDEVGFNSFKNLDKLIKNVRCNEVTTASGNELMEYHFESDTSFVKRKNKNVLVVDANKHFVAYKIMYLEEVAGSANRVDMTFDTIDFDCKKCKLKEDILSLVFEKKGKLKEEYADYELVDLRQNN